MLQQQTAPHSSSVERAQRHATKPSQRSASPADPATSESRDRAHYPGGSVVTDRVVRENYQRVYNTIVRRVSNRDVVIDLVQETFFQGIRSSETYAGVSGVGPWLTGIAINVARNYRRTTDRHRSAIEEIIGSQKCAGTSYRSGHDVAHIPNPEAVLEKRVRKQVVRTAIEQLPESYRQVLTMRDLQELTTEEVASALSLSEVNVRVRLSRARKALRKILVGMLRLAPTSQVFVDLNAVL